MGQPETKLAEASRLLGELNPDSRGVTAQLTDDVRATLKGLLADVKAEARALFGEDVGAVDDALPDSARTTYEWVLARIARVLKSGQDALREPVIPAPKAKLTKK